MCMSEWGTWERSCGTLSGSACLLSQNSWLLGTALLAVRRSESSWGASVLNLLLQEEIKMCSRSFWHLFANDVLEVEHRERERKGESSRASIWETTRLSRIHHLPCVGVTHRGRTRVVVISTSCLPDHSRAVTWRGMILHAGTEWCWWFCFRNIACLFVADWMWTGVRRRGQAERGRGERGEVI